MTVTGSIEVVPFSIVLSFPRVLYFSGIKPARPRAKSNPSKSLVYPTIRRRGC
jgi:hypothetical protein